MGNVFGYRSGEEQGETLHGRLSHIIELPPQPPDREVDIMFKMKLRRDGASTGEIELKLQEWTMEEKWGWVYRTALKPKKPSKGPKLSPREHVQVLSSPHLSRQGVVDHLDKIQHRAQKGQRRWKQDFTEAGGVTALSALLPNPNGGESHRNPSPSSVKLFQGALGALYFLLTLALAAQIFVQCDASMTRLLSCLYVGNVGEMFLKRTLIILRRLCESGHPAYSRVLRHFDLLRLRENENRRFERLVGIFASEKSSAALKSEALALINAILVAAPSLEERVKLRGDLCSHGLGIWIDEHLLHGQSTIPHPTLGSEYDSTSSSSTSSSRASSLAPSLKYQIGLFQASYSSDARQTQYRVVAEGRRAMEAGSLARRDRNDLGERTRERGRESKGKENMERKSGTAVDALQHLVLSEGAVDLSSTEDVFKALHTRAHGFQMESLLRSILLYLLSTSMDNILGVRVWTCAAKIVERVMRVSMFTEDIDESSGAQDVATKEQNKRPVGEMGVVADTWAKLHRQIDELEMTYDEKKALLDLRDRFQRLLLCDGKTASAEPPMREPKVTAVAEKAGGAELGKVKAIGAMLPRHLTLVIQNPESVEKLGKETDGALKPVGAVDRKAASAMLNNLFASRRPQPASTAPSSISSTSDSVDRKAASVALNNLFASRSSQSESTAPSPSSSTCDSVDRMAASVALNKLFAGRSLQPASTAPAPSSSGSDAVDRKAASAALNNLFAGRSPQPASTACTPSSSGSGAVDRNAASATLTKLFADRAGRLPVKNPPRACPSTTEGVGTESNFATTEAPVGTEGALNGGGKEGETGAKDLTKGVKVCQHEKFKPYFTMLKLGVPEGGVMQKMVKDGLDAALLQTPNALVDDIGRPLLGSTEPGEKKKEKEKKKRKTKEKKKKQSSKLSKVVNERMVGVRTRVMEDVPEQLHKYAKLLTMGMPADHALLRLSADGVDTEGFDLLIWLNGDAAKEEKIASSGSESESESESEGEGDGASAEKKNKKKPPMPSARAVLPAREPKAKLRPFYWETLDTEQIQGTIWEEIYRQLSENPAQGPHDEASVQKQQQDAINTDEEKEESVPVEEDGLTKTESELEKKGFQTSPRSMLEQALNIDMNTLERLFSQVTVTKKAETSKASHGSENKDDEGQHSASGATNNRRLKRRKSFLDPSRANMVAITASNMRVSASELREKLENMDLEFLTLEKTQKLLKALPTDEEARAVSSFKGSLDELSESDNFFAELGKIDRVGERLRAIELWHSFPQQIKSLTEQIACQRRACEEIISSHGFKGIMVSILKLGNCLNNGTSRGEAYGFKLCNLSKLIQVKAADKKTTLLHYLAQELRTSNEALVDVSKTMPAVEMARKTQLTQLRLDIKQLRDSSKGLMAELQRTSKEIEAMGQSECSTAVAKAKFVETMSLLASKAELELKSIDESFEHTLEQLKNTIASFGEDSAKLQPEDFFDCIFGFITELERVDKENRIARQAEQRERKREAEAAKRRLQRRSSMNNHTCSSTAVAEACEQIPALTRLRRLSTAGPFVPTQ